MNSDENLLDRVPDALMVGQDLSNSAIPFGTMGAVQLSGWTKEEGALHHQAAQGW
jgi:hypothetical protein